VRARVGPAYDPNYPWWVSLSFGFPADDKTPTSGPATTKP